MKWIIAVTVGVLAVLGAGAWVGTRHKPSGSLLEDPVRPFRIEAFGKGWLVAFNDTQMPLRSLTWIPPKQKGILVAQVLTQNDRQRIAVFRDGAQVADFVVGRPQGVGEGFWRFARLLDARVAQDGRVLLLYKAGDPSSSEQALAMAQEPGAPDAQWVHRGFYDHMAVGGGTEQAVFLYGTQGPILRLPLINSNRRPVAKEIPLPPEATAVDDLLATGAWTFLAATPSGLSAYLGTKGWAHYPAPDAPGVPCVGWASSLAQSGKRIWWQPSPGRLVQVGQDGALVADREVAGFLPDDPLARDARLLSLLGADAAGRLWFALATPAPVAPESALAAEDWAGYGAQGLDRIYRWNPDKETLERFPWSQAGATLAPPPGVPPSSPRVHPGAGSVLFEGGRAGWWLPLEALPFRPSKEGISQ